MALERIDNAADSPAPLGQAHASLNFFFISTEHLYSFSFASFSFPTLVWIKIVLKANKFKEWSKTKNGF